MTTTPIIPLNAHTLAIAFAATEYAAARADRDAFIQTLESFDHDFLALADALISDARDNLFDDYASFFYSNADLIAMTDAESDAIYDELLRLTRIDDESATIIQIALANAYETEYLTKY